MHFRAESILKFLCAAFVLYYTWLRVIIPSIEGYLLPFGLVMMGAIASYVLSHRRNYSRLIDFPIKSWILFGFVEYFAAYFIAIDVPFAQSSAVTFLELTGMCFAMIFVAKLDGDVGFLIKLMYVTCAGYVFSMLIINNQIQGRLALVNANGDANACLIGIVVATLIIDFKRNIQPIIILLTICMMFYANIMTGSRKSFLCMIFYLFFWFVVFIKTDWEILTFKKKLTLLGVVVIASSFFIQLVTPLIMNSTTVLRLLDGSTGDTLRLNLYSEAWEYFKTNPIFGIGYNQFRIYNENGYYSHSTYLEILADSGIVGTVLFFSPHIWCLVNLIKVAREYAHENFTELKKSLILLIYMLSSLILAAGMVQTSNERVLIMYAVMFAYIVCDQEKKRFQFKWAS